MKELIKTLWKHKIACLIIVITCINARRLEIENIMHGEFYTRGYFGTATKIGFIAIFFIVYCIGKIGYYRNILFIAIYLAVNQFIAYQLHAYFGVYNIGPYVIGAIFFLFPLTACFNFGYARSLLHKHTIRGKLAWGSAIILLIVLFLFLLWFIAGIFHIRLF